MKDSEYEHLISCIPDHYGDHRLMIQLLACGLRTNELVNIKIEDVDPERQSIYIHKETAKNRKDRYMFYPDSIKEAIVKQIKAREGRIYLFGRSSKRGETITDRYGEKPLTTRWIREMFSWWISISGLRGYSPHSLRHYAAEKMVRNKVPLDFIRQQLGHSSLVITQIYLSNNLEERKKAILSSGFKV